MGLIIDDDGNRYWYRNGELHRLDKPAVENIDGYKAWYIDGLRHRLDGPAMEFSNGEKHWYLEGKEYTEEEHKKVIKCC